MIPIYDQTNLYQSILRANKWLNNYVNLQEDNYYLPEYLQVKDNKNSLKIKNVFEKFFENKKYLLKLIEKIQYNKVRKNYGLYADMSDSRVVISDEFLKFHENDRRKEYSDKWVAKFKEIL